MGNPPATRPVKLLRITTVPMSLRILLGGQFRFMMQQGFDVHTVSANGDDIRSVLAEGATHEVIPFTRKITPWRDLRCLFQMIGAIRRYRPDIVHTHTPKAGLLGMLASWICRVPHRLHTVAGLPLMESTGATRSVLVMMEKLTYACAHKVFPNSRGLQEYIVENLGTNAAKLKIIGRGSSNGIDTRYFSRTEEMNARAAQIRKKHGIHAGDMVFTFVGRIVRDKGIVELIEAFKLFVDRIGKERRAFLFLVGPVEENLDPLPADTLRYINEKDNVILPGFQDDVRPWIAAADVFVFPSYREGFPNVVMQACLLEVPCIVTDINGSNEIITDKATGLIVPPKNAEALTEAMRHLADNPSLRAQYAQTARDFVRTNFDREYVWKELLAEYRRVMGY